MKVLFHLGHPAHFHLFKNTILSLRGKGHKTSILIKKKDVLQTLLDENNLPYQNILPKGRKDNKFSIAFGQLTQDYRLFLHCLFHRPDLMLGTSVAISHVGKLLKIPTINVNEDDFDVVPLYSKLAYPWANSILAPIVCRMGSWADKTVFYQGYHELAYLHPNNFAPSKEIARKYVNFEKPFFIIRFAKLGAHHDEGISGINNTIALEILKLILPFGNVYISSERTLIPELDEYRIQIRASDLHHVMAFAALYIGDSQTMAAEAGVLGVPFIRFNDFVGRISYLDELENKYQLGYGIKTKDSEILLKKIDDLLSMPDRKAVFQERREIMLQEKIDYASFLIWFIMNYPESVKIMKENPDYQYKFK